MSPAGPPRGFDLSGHHALVTAAGSDLGRALAVALAEAGATVSVTTLRDDPAEEPAVHSVINECWSLGREGAVRRLDLTNLAAVEAACDALEQQCGPIDILVHTAHEAPLGPFVETDPAAWRGAVDANVTSAYTVMRAVGPRMLGRGLGRIVQVVSVLHDRGMPHTATFGATQGALLALVRGLGLEWGPRGVSVNALGVGFIDGLPGPHTDPEVRAVLERYIPVRRLGTVADLQGACLLLAAGAGSFINAEIVTVDGAIGVHA